MHRFVRRSRWIHLAVTGPRLPDQCEEFERLEARLGAATPNVAGLPDDNCGGALAWDTSWRMQAHLMMAETTGDPGYLHRLVRMMDAVLDRRDTALGHVDFRGVSRPVWSAARRYTAVILTLADTEGRPALEVRLTPPHAIGATVTATPGPDGTFDLTVDRANKVHHELTGLSLDPDSPRRADRIAYDGYTVANGTTVRLVPGPDGTHPGDRRLAAGTHRPAPVRVSLAAHTGMIVHPFAGLARLARERPELIPTEVHRRIDGYLAAVVEALAVHDDQWRVTADGEGYYVWLRDEPVSHAGAELPTNEFLTIGRALVQLAAATGEPRYVDRAHAMAVTLRRQMQVDGDAFVWPYWPSFGHVYSGWQRTGDPATDVSDFRPEYHAVPVAEDVTHSLIDIDFACLYAGTPGLPQVFTDDDMRRLARTFTERVAYRRFGRRPTIRRYVSGIGKLGSARDEAHTACWLPLRQWSPTVRTPVLAVHHARRPSGTHGVDSYCAALLHRWGRPGLSPAQDRAADRRAGSLP